MLALLTNPILYWGGSIVAILALAAREAVRCGLDPRAIYIAGLVSLAGALGGGWLYNTLISGPDLHAGGGFAAIGAFAGASLAGGLALRLMGAPALRHANAAVPAIALGYAIYRVGCFFNGCCHGTETTVPWSVLSYPGQGAYESQMAQGLIPAAAAHSLPVHPVQLYHAAFGLAGFFILLRMRHTDGHARLAAALVLYGASRIGLEFLRGEAHPIWGPFDINQLGAALMLLMGLALGHTQRHQARLDPT
jgi:phosphatidylglycerol:prolipoprotein diacylglycerol transferase